MRSVMSCIYNPRSVLSRAARVDNHPMWVQIAACCPPAPTPVPSAATGPASPTPLLGVPPCAAHRDEWISAGVAEYDHLLAQPLTPAGLRNLR
jgi:hypothetical protein